MENCAFAVDPSDFVNNIVNVGTYVPGPPIKIMATIPRKHKLVKAGAWCMVHYPNKSVQKQHVNYPNKSPNLAVSIT